jgi:signal transduction histidine kinase/streptogramin lyase/DNA-binding NarL/FixJ family response regulator
MDKRKQIHLLTKWYGRIALMLVAMLGAEGTAAYAQQPVNRPATTGSAAIAPRLTLTQALDTGGRFFNGGFIQDRDGFFWIATLSGLLKWDGYTLKKPKGSPEAIYAIYEDTAGLIWVSSSTGLSRYDKSVDAFTVYRHDPNDPKSIGEGAAILAMQSIAEDSTGNIWYGTQKGLNRYDKQTNAFTGYAHDRADPHSLINDNVTALYADTQGTVWVGTEGGLDKFDPSTGTFSHYRNQPDNPGSLSNNIVTALLEDRNGVLWVGTKEGGLNRLDKSSGTFTRYLHDPQNPHSLKDNFVFAIAEIDTDELWLTHWDNTSGIDILNTKTEVFLNYRDDPNNPRRESYNQTANVYKDRLGIIWVVHFNGILDKIDPASHSFELYRHNPNNRNSLAENSVFNVYQDKLGMMWISFASKGLDKFDRRTDTFTHYPDMPGGLAQSTLEDNTGLFWMAGAGGIFSFDRTSGTYSDVYPLQCKSGQIILPDRNNANILWVGTDAGLVRFDKTTKQWMKFRHEPNNPDSICNDTMWNLFMDKAGFIWIPTYGGGLDKFDPETEKVVAHYKNSPNDPKSLGSDALNHVFEDSAGRIWVGTVDSGLNKLNPDGTFTRYNEETGILTNWVGSIIEDNQGFLWLGTKIGLIRFDPKSETWRLYTQDDGLQSNEFLEYPNYKAPDGELWVFGGNGLNSFYPDKLKDNPYQPPVYFTALTQGNEPVKNVQQAPERVKALTLTWQSNFFEFEVAALNFTRPEKNQYRYFLEGFDKAWYNAGTKRTGRYSNLPDGTYTLRVRGSNNDGVWSQQEAALVVTVLPPWWHTRWFQGLVLAGLLGTMLGGYRLRVRSIQQRSRMLEKQVAERTVELTDANRQLQEAKEKAETANRAKSTFLANMSHELRTPLNAVLGFSQMLKRDPDVSAKQRESLGIINRSGEYLLNLINNVLDISKIESGLVMLEKAPLDLHQLMEELKTMMDTRAWERGLDFAVEQSPDLPRYVAIDPGKLRQVLINLIDNAVKYTKKGRVILRGMVVKDKTPQRVLLGFDVEDTGPGIRAEDRERIFTAFVQLGERPPTEAGTGLGLAICKQYVELMGGTIGVGSEPGKGSLFHLEVPAAVLPVEAIPTEPRSGRLIGPAEGQPRYRLLIAEDQPDNRLLLRKMMEPLGFELREAKNGQEAVDVFSQWHPHLIWMDVRMPVMDGLAATRQIKATDAGAQTKIVAVTAHALEEERREILAAGCDDFIRKPYRETDLHDALARHLGIRFIYEVEPSTADIAPRLNAADLARLPDTLLKQLELALIRLDTCAVDCAVKEIRSHDPLVADGLAALSRDTEFGRMLRLVREASPKQPTGEDND